MLVEEKFPRDFGDDYELQSVLGVGGMGKVYLAVHKKLNRYSAIKIIRSEMLDLADEEKSQRIIQQFDSEIKTTARLSHKSIVTVYDAGYVDGQFFYSMKYINGDSLSELIENGPISGNRAAKIVMQVAKGVHHAHQNGILHRDIKPGNVMVDVENNSFIMDFGVSKELKKTTQTDTGELFGTISYMSPEQARNSSQLDERSDVYSLGAVFYFALSGKPPLIASTELQTLAYLATLEPVELKKVNSSVGNDLNAICMKCLEKEPGARYQSAEELAEDLDRYLQGEPVKAKPISVTRKVTRWAKGKKRQLTVAALLVLVLGTIFFVNERLTRVSKVASLVESLQTAEPIEIPRIIRELRSYQSTSKPVLEEKFQSERDENIRFRLSLPFRGDQIQPSQVVFSKDFEKQFEIFDASIEELPQVSQQEIDRLWKIAFDEKEEQRIRLKASTLLAKLDLQSAEKWEDISEGLAALILQLDTIEANSYLHRLESVLPWLAESFRVAFNEKKSVQTAEIGALALAMHYQDNPKELCNLIVKSTPNQFSFLFPRVEQHRNAAVPILKKIAEQQIPHFPRFGPNQIMEMDGDLPGLKGTEFFIVRFPEDKERAEKSIAYIALVRMGEIGWGECFELVKDPVVQSKVLHDCELYRCPIEPLINVLENELIKKNPDADLVILTLGSYMKAIDGSKIKKRVTNRVKELFENDPRAGVHSAAEWVLREFTAIDIKGLKGKSLGDAERRQCDWYVTPSGLTMAAIRRDFELKVPVSWGSTQIYFDWAGFSRPDDFWPPAFREYAMSTKEITKEQFSKFRKLRKHNFRFGRHASCPINGVQAKDAMMYCNWLTIQDGFDETEVCYEEVDGRMVLVSDYFERKGYRLPTVWEWDNAANNNYKLLLSNLCYLNYFWVLENSKGSSQFVGLLKPNRSGLFDMYGNVPEICTQSSFGKNECFVFRGNSAANWIPRLRQFLRIIDFGRISTDGGGLRVVQAIAIND